MCQLRGLGDSALQRGDRRGRVVTLQMTQPFDLQTFGIIWVREQCPADLGEGVVRAAQLEVQARATALRGQDRGVVHRRILAKIGVSAANAL